MTMTNLEYMQERQRIATRRFDDLKTMVLASAVASPIAMTVGMLIGDWWMIGLAMAIVMSCGLGSLYTLKRLEDQLTARR